jgi:hypothetical protein
MSRFEFAAIDRAPNAVKVALAIGVGCGLAMLFIWNPATEHKFPACPFRALTGYYCPGCGSLRATHQLLHGSIWNALRLNPLYVVCLPFLAYAVAASRWPALKVAWVKQKTRGAAWPLFLLAVFVVFWVLRNLPWAPFSWLAPNGAADAVGPQGLHHGLEWLRSWML